MEPFRPFLGSETPLFPLPYLHAPSSSNSSLRDHFTARVIGLQGYPGGHVYPLRDLGIRRPTKTQHLIETFVNPRRPHRWSPLQLRNHVQGLCHCQLVRNGRRVPCVHRQRPRRVTNFPAGPPRPFPAFLRKPERRKYSAVSKKVENQRTSEIPIATIAEPKVISPYWPHVREAMYQSWQAWKARRMSPDELDLGSVTCEICQSAELVIKGIQSRRDPAELEAKGITQEEGVVVACGHVFGRPCIEWWQAQCDEKDQPFTCPTCRFDLDPRRCYMHRSFGPLITSLEGANSPLSYWFIRAAEPNGLANKAEADDCWGCHHLGWTRAERARGVRRPEDD